MDIIDGVLGKFNSEINGDAVKEFYDDRILILDDVITDDILRDCILHILLWNKDDRDIPIDKRRPIRIYIDSDGGSVFAAHNLIEVIQCSTTPVYGVAFSVAASAACSILIGCDKRYCFPHTMTLLHDGQINLGPGTTNKQKDTMKFMNRVDDMVKDFIISKTNITEEEYDINKDREQYFFASEAREKGIVDYIIGVDCDLDEIF